MNGEVTVKLYDVVGSGLMVSSADGQLVHDKIAPLLREGRKVVLSFAQAETVISIFLNAAVGQLYGEFSEERIRELLAVKDITPDDALLMKRVVENSKAYFRNRTQFDEAWKAEAGDGE